MRGYNSRMSKRGTTTRKNSRVGGRDARTGHFVPLKETERRPTTTLRERIPIKGRWVRVDGGTYKAQSAGKSVYRTSPSGRFTERKNLPVSSAKGEWLIIYVNEAGAVASRKSTETLNKIAKRAAKSLKRLAKR